MMVQAVPTCKIRSGGTGACDSGMPTLGEKQSNQDQLGAVFVPGGKEGGKSHDERSSGREERLAKQRR